MVYGYVRVSTKGQLEGNSIEDQMTEIEKKYPGTIFVSESLSGAKERPKFTQLISELQSEDLLVVTKLDRFCRTTKEGLGYIDTLMNKGVQIHILNMGLIDSTPIGRMIITNLLAFAEFERAMIIERTQGGKAIAKKKEGFTEGRPNVYSKIKKDHALDLLKDHSYKEVEALTGISVSTLHRYRRHKLITKLTELN